MPPRSEEELDPVTLHNQALMNMEDRPTEGFEKIQYLLQQPTCPKEAFSNLLLLYIKFEARISLIRKMAMNQTFTLLCSSFKLYYSFGYPSPLELNAISIYYVLAVMPALHYGSVFNLVWHLAASSAKKYGYQMPFEIV